MLHLCAGGHMPESYWSQILLIACNCKYITDHHHHQQQQQQQQ
jgi:hypothetical protein